MKKKSMEQLNETFLDYFKKNKGVYSHNDVEKIVDQAILNERARVEKIIDRHCDWEPTEGCGSEEELGFQKGLMAEAKLIRKDLLVKLTKESKTDIAYWCGFNNGKLDGRNEVVDEVAKQFNAVRVNKDKWAFPEHPHTQLRAKENYQIGLVLRAFDEVLNRESKT